MATTYIEGYESEVKRMDFMVNRDGPELARQFAERTLCTYHTALSNKKHFLSSSQYRPGVIGSIVYLEQFVGDVLFLGTNIAEAEARAFVERYQEVK